MSLRQHFLVGCLLLASACDCAPEEPGPPQVVPAEVLASMIPAQIQRWTADLNTPAMLPSANGGTIARTAGALFFEGVPQISFELIDCLEAPELVNALMINMNSDSEGYTKFTAQGHPAVEVSSARPLNTVLHIWIAQRFWLRLSGESQTPKTMAEVLAGFDLTRIARLAR